MDKVYVVITGDFNSTVLCGLDEPGIRGICYRTREEAEKHTDIFSWVAELTMLEEEEKNGGCK